MYRYNKHVQQQELLIVRAPIRHIYSYTRGKVIFTHDHHPPSWPNDDLAVLEAPADRPVETARGPRTLPGRHREAAHRSNWSQKSAVFHYRRNRTPDPRSRFYDAQGVHSASRATDKKDGL